MIGMWWKCLSRKYINEYWVKNTDNRILSIIT